MESIQEKDYLKSHLQVLEFFVSKIKPVLSIELGCGEFTTKIMDENSTNHLVYDSVNRRRYVEEVEKELNPVLTSFVLYQRIEEVFNELGLFDVQYDIGIVSGPRSDRSLFAQKLLDTNCKCCLLLDYESDIFGYSKIRKPNKYDFRSFLNEETGVETGVFLLNYLSHLKIKGHK